MLTPVEARAALADALESGEFEQGKGTLCLDGKYCCLGVACELFIRDGGELTVIVLTDFIKPGTQKIYGGRRHYLPQKVQDWLGFADNWGTLKIKNQKGSYDGLANLNDEGHTFKEIAQVIRDDKVELKT